MVNRYYVKQQYDKLTATAPSRTWTWPRWSPDAADELDPVAAGRSLLVADVE